MLDLKERLKEKIEKEEVEVSDKMANITHIVTKDVINKNINFIGTESSIYLIKNLLLISSLLSLIIGTVVGLAQSKIKRLLAYSTISHIGFMLLALAINTEQSIDSLLFYIIQYSITNLNIFLIIIALSFIMNNSYIYTYKDIKFISEFKGQFFLNPILSLSLVIYCVLYYYLLFCCFVLCIYLFCFILCCVMLVN